MAAKRQGMPVVREQKREALGIVGSVDSPVLHVVSVMQVTVPLAAETEVFAVEQVADRVGVELLACQQPPGK